MFTAWMQIPGFGLTLGNSNVIYSRVESMLLLDIHYYFLEFGEIPIAIKHNKAQVCILQNGVSYDGCYLPF